MLELWTLCAVVTSLLALGYGIDYALRLRAHPEEPEYILPRLPLFGHLFGMMQYGTGYYSHTGARVPGTDFYTLPILNLKLYVAQNSQLISAIQRAAKTLSFGPFAEALAKGWCALSPPTIDLYSRKDGGAFLSEFDGATRNALAPGPNLDAMNKDTAETVLSFIDEMAAQIDGEGVPKREGLFAWVKRTITMASTRGLYGPSNPFDDRKVYDAFWTYDEGIAVLTTNFLTSIFARSAVAARGRLVAALEAYYRADGPAKGGSFVVQERYNIPVKHNVPLNDIARVEAAMEVALLTNTVPTAFWAVYDIFSRPTLVSALREEIAGVVAESTDASTGESKFDLDVSAMKSHCRLLLSAYQETQRTLHTHANIRKITDDTLLANQYLVKKGHYVQIPNAPIHRSTAVWGADAAKYNPLRFMGTKGTKTADKLPSYSFLAWGLAPNLCPARQFATTEILIFIAIMIMRLEISLVHKKDLKHAPDAQANGSAKDEFASTWVPPAQNIGIFATIWPPKGEVEVDFRMRKDGDYARGKWSVKLGESMSKFALASG